MIGSFGGINEEAIHPSQRRFQLLRCRQSPDGISSRLTRVLYSTGESYAGVIGFRTCYLKLLPEHIKVGDVS